jgi:glycosyltransferase involved in cell wall biosynthesis
LEVVFLFDNVWNHPFDQRKLLSQLKFHYSFLLNGPCYKGRVFRFGILKAIRKFNPDIIIGYEYSFTTQYLLLLKRWGLIRAKIGSMIDDSVDICYHVQSKGRYFIRNHSVNQLDFLVLLSKEVSNFYQQTFGLSETQIVVSPILQSAQRLRENPEVLEGIAHIYQQEYSLKGKKVLLFVGRLIPEKALLRFIKTNQTVLHDEANFVFVIIGDGIERDAIEEVVQAFHLENKVLHPGRFEGAELYAWYLCASGFVLPSTYESFGAVVNEALIFGVPVLCSTYAGASSLIRNDCGLIFDPLNEQDTNEKLRMFLDSMDVISEIDLSKRGSLMQNNQIEFMNQWRKISND